MKGNITLSLKKAYWSILLISIVLIAGSVLILPHILRTLFFMLATDTSPTNLSRYLPLFYRIQISVLIFAGICILLAVLLLYREYKFGESRLKINFDHDPKKIIVLSLLLVWFIGFLCIVAIQANYAYVQHNRMNGLSNDEIKIKWSISSGVGESYYTFIEDAKKQIPKDENVLWMVDPIFCWGYYWPEYVSYYLYPIKLYYYPNSSKLYGHHRPKPSLEYKNITLSNINETWLNERGIKWIIICNETTDSKCRELKMLNISTLSNDSNLTGRWN